MYEKARSGQLLDNELVVDAMPYFAAPGIYDVYVAFMGIEDAHKTPGFRAMLHSIFTTLHKLAKADIFIGRVCANGLSTSGRSLCRQNMKYLGKHRFSGEVYEANMSDLLNMVFQNSPPLAREYKSLSLAYRTRFTD
jgi:hypothetical protein